MNKPKVLGALTIYEKYCENSKKMLEQAGFEVVTYGATPIMPKEEILKHAPNLYGAIVGTEEWSEDILEACPNLKIVARFGAGVDNIDLDAAKRLGIKVINARGANSDSVAEATIMLVLSCLRNLLLLDRTTREGGWIRKPGNIIRGKTYGLVGFGAIAQYVAKLLESFEVEKIYAYDIVQNHDAAAKYNVTFTDMNTLIKESDIISLHVPSTSETEKLFSKNEFELMKNTAILVNVARGNVVDEVALYEALKMKKIAAAGLDVFAVEPTSADNPLFALDNVTVMPHITADTYETFEAVGKFCAQAIIDNYNGKEPPNWLNA